MRYIDTEGWVCLIADVHIQINAFERKMVPIWLLPADHASACRKENFCCPLKPRNKMDFLPEMDVHGFPSGADGKMIKINASFQFLPAAWP